MSMYEDDEVRPFDDPVKSDAERLDDLTPAFEVVDAGEDVQAPPDEPVRWTVGHVPQLGVQASPIYVRPFVRQKIAYAHDVWTPSDSTATELIGFDPDRIGLLLIATSSTMRFALSEADLRSGRGFPVPDMSAPSSPINLEGWTAPLWVRDLDFVPGNTLYVLSRSLVSGVRSD